MSLNGTSPEVRALIKRDLVLRQQMQDYGYGQSDKILEILYKRYRLYEEYTPVVKDKDIILLSNMKERVGIEIMLFKSKSEIEKQISKVISRIDILEEEVKKLKTGGNKNG